jgi:hypothetical protein
MKSAQDRRVHTRQTVEALVIADLDTLLIALYVELTDRVIPALGLRRRGPGRPPEVTDAELVCLAVAQVLLRYNDERHWLRAAPTRGDTCSPLAEPERVQPAAQGPGATAGGCAAVAGRHDPGVGGAAAAAGRHAGGCGQSIITAKRSRLFGYAGYGYEPSHSRYYWGVKLLLLVTADGTVTGFGLANPKLVGERQAGQQLLGAQPANRPPIGSAVVTDKGLAGADTEAFFAGLELALIRPARSDEPQPRPFPNWLRQRVEAIIWTLKRQLGLEHHGGRVPAGLWARVLQRLLALNTAIWHNWQIGAPVKRSLIAYDH